MWSFVLFALSIDILTKAHTHYFLFWSVTALLVVFGWVTAIGLAITGLGAALRASSARAYDVLAPIGALACVGFVAHAYPVLNFVILILAPAGVIWARVRRIRWNLATVHGLLQKACLFLSPVLPIFWLNATTFERYGPTTVPSLEDARRVPARPGRVATDDFYLFVFDGWSGQFTLPGGKVNPEFPNLAAAAEEMCLFTDAHSPACFTVNSLPRLLFQTRARFALRGGTLGFWDGEFHAARELPSLFTRARERGYRTYMVGWFHPYQVLLGDTTDFVRSVCYGHHLGETPWQLGLAFLWDSVHAVDPKLAAATVGSFPVMRNHAIAWQCATLVEYARAVLDDPRPGQFAVFHLPPPHWPYCFTRNGPRADLNVEYEDTVANAMDSHRYVDHLIGDFRSRLRDSGRWEDATVVFVSDHSCPDDPELHRAPSAEQWNHVPLLIKFPGQRQTVRVDAPFSTVHLAEVLDAVRERHTAREDLDRLVRERRLHEPLADEELYFRHPIMK